jgi:glycerol kinase
MCQPKSLLLNIHTLEWDTELLELSHTKSNVARGTPKEVCLKQLQLFFFNKIPIAVAGDHKQLYLVNYAA